MNEINVYFRLIIMAAGYSRRFAGQNKLLADFRGEPLCLPVIRAVAAVTEILGAHAAGLLVSGHKEVRRLGEEAGLISLDNPNAIVGQSASVRIGLLHPVGWEAKEEYAIFLPADQPLLNKTDLLYFAERIKTGRVGLWRSEAHGRFDSPTAFHKRYYPELLVLSGDSGGKGIFQNHKEQVKTVSLPLAALQDVDTPADLEKLQTEIEEKG